MAGGFNQTWEVNPYDTLLQPSANQNIANRTLAPLFAGWILNLICFGMVCSSFFTHFGTQHYRRDNPKLRVSSEIDAGSHCEDAFSLISTLAARKTVSEGGSFPSNSGPNSTSLGGNASRGPKSKNGGRVKDQFAQSIQVHQTTTAAVNVDLELYDLPLEKGSVQHEGGDLPKVQWAS
ncbi:hypothetical protein P7C70_g4633, partial [Phenoliferia sp. Uapishka_3]